MPAAPKFLQVHLVERAVEVNTRFCVNRDTVCAGFSICLNRTLGIFDH